MAWGGEAFLRAGAYLTLEATTTHTCEGRHSWGGGQRPCSCPGFPFFTSCFPISTPSLANLLPCWRCWCTEHGGEVSELACGLSLYREPAGLCRTGWGLIRGPGTGPACVKAHVCLLGAGGGAEWNQEAGSRDGQQRGAPVCALVSDSSSLVPSVPQVTNLRITLPCSPSLYFTREHIESPPLHI